MPEVRNIEEAKEAARFFKDKPDYDIICVDSEGSIYLNREPKGLEEELKGLKLKMFQVRPEIAVVEESKSTIKQKKNTTNE